MKNRSRLNQTWAIARIELRRAFFSKRAFWVYDLALFPSLIFFGNSLHVKFHRRSLASNGLKPPAMLDSLKTGESAEAILKRVGTPSSDYEWEASRRIRD